VNMTARFETVEKIFHAALDHAPDDRGAFLDERCADDKVLRSKVEELLAAHCRAGDFIETPIATYARSIITGNGTDSLIGKTIGHYKISNRIGAGGMGEVYLATDTIAGRNAALKFLAARFTDDAERLKRFQQEARTVAGLNHPNVLTVYEIGTHNSTHYIASELIQGETLRERLARGPMQLNEAIEIAIQVASALGAAHQVGIVHRDIKPENLMLRPDGYVKVLDFGIAKLAEEEIPATVAEEEAVKLVETNLGSILGTVSYMSPEQARGAPVSKSTDIWSLGVVLYEMRAGCAPFAGGTPRQVMASILATEPRPISHYGVQVPGEFQQIVTKALHKEPAQRYQSANEMLDTLKRLGRKLELTAEFEGAAVKLRWLRVTRSPGAVAVGLLVGALALAIPFYWLRTPTTNSTPEKSVAVLPFANLSRESDSGYFAHGIRGQIVARLAKIANLKVVSGSLTERYQSSPENPAQIASNLGVSDILEGSVEKLGEKFRIAVRLIDAKKNADIWTQSYDRSFSGVIQAESEVARHVAGALGVNLTESERRAINKGTTSNPRAYEAYLKGRYVWLQRSLDGFRQAKEYFDQAIALDPNCAQAYAGLADAYHFLGAAELHDRRENYEKAKAAYQRALQLDPTLAEAHASAGLVAMNYDWDWPLAEQELQRAIALDPNNALFYDWYAEYLMAIGKVSNSIDNIERARKLDPFSVIINSDLGKLLFFGRRYDEAEAQLKETLRMDPDFAEAHCYLGLVYTMKHRFDDAIAEFKMSEAKSTQSWGLTGTWGFMAYAYGMEGRRIEAEQILEAIRKVAARRGDIDKWPLAIAYIGLGEKDRAFECLEQDCENHAIIMVSLKSNPGLDSLRSDPRFVDLMRRVHLAP